MKIKQVETIKSKALGIIEKDIEDAIVLNPSMLNLPAKVRVVAQQRHHSRAGILDLLLQTEDQETRYVVEIQMSVLDESHIIRTIEYWDIERRNNPSFNHVAVIVAEGIGRFLNVIGLLAGRIPIVVINMTMLKNDTDAGVIFSTVIDQTETATDDVDLPNVVSRNREQWVHEQTEEKIRRIEDICRILSQTRFAPRFNVQKYIALGDNNQAVFFPQTRSIVMNVRLDQSDEVDNYIIRNSIDTLPYDSRHKLYRIYLGVGKLAPQEEALLNYLSRDLFPSNSDEVALSPPSHLCHSGVS